MNSSDKMVALCEKSKLISQLLFYNHKDMHDLPKDHSNWRDEMIFQSYENLWKIIHILNTEWKELTSRGLTNVQIETFSLAFYYSRRNYNEQSENIKLQLFMNMLDGKLK